MDQPSRFPQTIELREDLRNVAMRRRNEAPKFTNKYMLMNDKLCAHLINMQSVCMSMSLKFSVRCLSVASLSEIL